MALVTNKQTTAKEWKWQSCIRNQGTIGLHCLTKSHISFMMQVSDGDSRLRTTTKAIYFIFRLLFVFFSTVCIFFVFFFWLGIVHFDRFDIVRQKLKGVFFVSCLCRHQCYTDFCTYRRLFGGLSSFSDCRIVVES